MLTPTLVGGLFLSILTAVLYLVVGVIVYRRSHQQAHKGPAVAFAVWWGGLAAYTVLGVALQFVAATDLFEGVLVKTLLHMSVPPLVVALWGLFYYLGYIFVGGRRLLAPSLVLYGAIYATFVYITSYLVPVGARQRTWDVALEYANVVPGWVNTVVLALLIVPILIAVLAYASLLFRMKGAEQRFRIGMVSFAFVAWFGGAFLAALLGLDRFEWWGLAGRLIALGSAALVLLAFAPPERMRHRFVSRDLQPPLLSRDHENG